MSKHTPGPWEYRGHAWVQTADDKKIPIANFNFYAATEANARLIAAAPELLEASKEMLQLIDTICRVEGATVRKARAAIAKATGEQV